MNGAESLVRTLADSGIELCLANPGTSEMHVAAALEDEPRIKAVLTLFEGVAAGAADGYARIAGKPAMTLLHLGPGFGNAVANLHNARKGGVGVLNVVGDHATSHARYEQAPLSSDIEGICRPVSDFLRHASDAATLARDGAEAAAAANAGGIATLLVPADAAWDAGGMVAPPAAVRVPAAVDADVIARVVAALRGGKRALLLMRGRCLERDGLEIAGRIAQKTGARLAHDCFTPRVTRGAGLPAVERLPYFAEDILATLAGLELIVLVGAAAPVSFFAYPHLPGWMTPPGCALLILSVPDEDSVGALAALADLLGADTPAPRVTRIVPDLPDAALTPDALGRVMARLMPDSAILSDEALTTGPAIQPHLANAAWHDAIFTTGGAIGDALPMALGAALAAPDRKVVAVSGDGAAAYTLQALWTMARARTDVVSVICANRSYNILNIELARVGALTPGPKTHALLDLHDPVIDWVKLSEGFGVQASRAQTVAEFAAQFADAMTRPGPRLIEAVLQP